MKQFMGYFRRERLRFASLKLSLFYIFDNTYGGTEFKAGNHFQFRIVSLFLWLVDSNAAVLQSDAFLITNP